MPPDRMVFGLIAHNLKFFASDNVSNLQAADDYKSWCESMSHCLVTSGHQCTGVQCGLVR